VIAIRKDTGKEKEQCGNIAYKPQTNAQFDNPLEMIRLKMSKLHQSNRWSVLVFQRIPELLAPPQPQAPEPESRSSGEPRIS